MAQATSQRDFENRAFDDPYASMSKEDKEHVASMEIIPVDATKSEELSEEMSWAEKHIGLRNSVLSVTDYGRHRSECDNLAEFREFIREKIRDGVGCQYLKVMDESKENVAETLLAISRANGYVVVPYFE